MSGADWRANAAALASWTMRTLVNRRDVWGNYRPWVGRDGVEHTTMTAPSTVRRGIDQLDAGILEAHYRGERFGRVGLHSTSRENTSRWLGIDVDRHEDTPESVATADTNLALVRRIVTWCRDHHYRVLVEDSNGGGGFHVWLLLDAPAPTADVFALGEQINRELGATLETFPKQASIGTGKFGNWLRLPGRHHTRAHWSRVARRGEWLEGAAAVTAILHAPINSAQLIPGAPSDPPSSSSSSSSSPSHSPHVHGGRAPSTNAPRDLKRVIEAYLAKIPSLAAGQNRNRAGYRFACFLIRDLALSDADALPWLTAWNKANQTPYPDSKVASLLADAHEYGNHAIAGGPGAPQAQNSKRSAWDFHLSRALHESSPS